MAEEPAAAWVLARTRMAAEVVSFLQLTSAATLFLGFPSCSAAAWLPHVQRGVWDRHAQVSALCSTHRIHMLAWLSDVLALLVP